MVGELGLYLGTRRSASAVADCQTIAYRLTRSALLVMKEQEPELAAAFHEFMIRQTCERLAFVNRLLKAMLK
ncbi:MAG: hypothetical protein JXA93_20245 [Anaerolineae bacterium]|nr:hypothetical protein [Anaerolineae bacterium]